MKNDQEMHYVLKAVRLARALAIDSVKQNFPDLYAISARVFETMPPGNFGHHERLGEYLTEWSNSLGRSPLEALVMGNPSEVLGDLVGRTDDNPEPIDDVDIAPSEPSRHPLDEDPPVGMAFCYHYAAEEGVSVFLSVASSAAGATRIFLEQAPDHFHGGMQLAVISNGEDRDADPMQTWISKRALDLIASNPPGTTVLYMTLHYNLAS